VFWYIAPCLLVTANIWKDCVGFSSPQSKDCLTEDDLAAIGFASEHGVTHQKS
jgi:hypothetical protein